jgi:HSP20 family molecular chaperone IbpA
MNTATEPITHAASSVRQTIIRRLNHPTLFRISPFERWADDNYAPDELRFIERYTSDQYEIIAPLHGYEEPDVHVDLARGHVIILLSQDYTAPGFNGREYYCEVPIPDGFDTQELALEISQGYLTVRLNRAQTALRLAASGLRRLARGLGLVAGGGWRLRHLEEPEYS